MAIGDTVNAGLMRVDFSPFLEAGRANAAANASFGQALGQVVKGYIEGQEKKKRTNEIAGFLMGQGVAEKDATAIAKNPFLQKEYQRKKEADVRKEIAAMQARSKGDGGLAQRKYEDAQEEKRLETERQVKFAKELLTETTDPAVQGNADMARPGLFALGGDTEMRNRFLDAQIEQQPKTTVGNLGSEDFATVARETGMDPRMSANRFMSLQAGEAKQTQEELASQPKPMTPEEEAKYRGTLLDNRRKELELDQKINPKPTANIAYTEATLNAISDAGNILERSGLPSTGFWGDRLQNIGGTNAADLRASVETIVSSIGFDKLQDMRDRSPTGGALGQVSERELAQLNASLGSLKQSQSKEQFQKNLMRVKDHYQKYYKATMAQVKAYEQGLKFETEEQAMSWYNKNFPMGGKPAPDNQTNIITKGGFVLTAPGN